MTKARILADYVAGGTTASEFDYMDGVTSNVQTQLDAKATTDSSASFSTVDCGTQCTSASYKTDTYVAKGQVNGTNLDWTNVINMSSLAPGIYQYYMTINGNYSAFGTGGTLQVAKSTDWTSATKYVVSHTYKGGSTNQDISGTYIRMWFSVGSNQVLMWSIKRIMETSTTITT